MLFEGFFINKTIHSYNVVVLSAPHHMEKNKMFLTSNVPSAVLSFFYLYINTNNRPGYTQDKYLYIRLGKQNITKCCIRFQGYRNQKKRAL